MASTADDSALLGRSVECQTLDHLVASLRAGQSRSLVIRADAGMGKSALLDYLADHAPGCRVLRAVGAESEMELAYAGLHQLCAPLLDQLATLAPPQRTALGVALGLRTGDAPDRFLVGLAVLNLLSASAAERPLLCLVDDAQWLDLASRQTLAFVARRLVAESVGLVFAVREPTDDAAFSGVEDLTLTGLDDADARRLLDSVVNGPLDAAVRDRIIAETGGNPLALTALPRGLSPAEIAGGYGLSPAAGLSTRIEDSFVRRVEALPEATRRILVVAALEPVGDPRLVFRAADSLGLTGSAFTPAVHDGLVELGVTLRFRHPLMRSAAVRAAPFGQLQEAHRALAEATDPEADPDRRAWHRAEAMIGFDEDVAAELVRSARRAQARGGLAAAAAFHQRAVELTPDPQRRARRALMAAEDKFRAGAAADAVALLDFANPRYLDEHQRARAELVRARVAHAVTRGRDAPRLLLRAAKLLQPHDPEASLVIYSDAFGAALSSGDRATGKNLVDVAEAILDAEAPMPLSDASEAARDALHGLALLVTKGYADAAPMLRSALAGFRRLVADGHAPNTTATLTRGSRGAAASAGDETSSAEKPSPTRQARGLGADATADDSILRWLPLACRVARTLSDDAAYDELSELQLRRSRSVGALAFLPISMADRLSALMWSGRLGDAAALADAIEPVIAATGSPHTLSRRMWISAFRGDESDTLAIIETQRDAATESGEGHWFNSVAYACGLVYNALGRYADAFAALERAAGHPFDIGMALWLLPERIEAGVRSGHEPDAQASWTRLSEIAEACDTAWAQGVAARCAALLADGGEAERLYLRSLELLGRTRMTAALARTSLVYGEWLRRENRRVEAREQLRIAYELFGDMGVNGFAERARRELFATGETVHRRSTDALEELTAQELQIATLAAGAATNPEIGARLYLSPRTVEWHLRKIFSKLDITSRRQLAGALRRAHH